MAGIAALMRTRKERERKRLGQDDASQIEETGFSEAPGGKDGKRTPGELSKKASTFSMNQGPRTLKKAGTQQSLVKKKAGNKLDGSKPKGRDKFNTDVILTQSYTPVYLGFVFISIGLVITFVGLGDKGFRTIELRLIGPTLCIFGLICILFKIVQCHFPSLCVLPQWLKKARMSDVEDSILVEKGLKNGHLSNNSKPTTPQKIFSPRVILQSANQPPRPKSTSTIPNYIDDSSDDDTDFDHGRRHPRPAFAHQYHSVEDKKNAEIILDPKTLMP